MLGAGFFTTQKSQEVVHTGVTQASSSLAPSGDVIVQGADTTLDDTGAAATVAAGGSAAANELIFYITNTAGGTPVDLDKTVITYTDNDNFVTVPHRTTIGGTTYGANGAVALAAIPVNYTAWEALSPLSTGWLYNGVIITDGTTNGDNLLSAGEKYKVVIYLPEVLKFATPGSVGAADPTGAKLPVTNEKFTIQLKPPEGAVLSITKTLPPAIAEKQFYTVY
jgi:flagellin FlaB